jgi:hypothetical protein
MNNNSFTNEDEITNDKELEAKKKILKNELENTISLSYKKNDRNINSLTHRSNKSFKTSFIGLNWRDINITSIIPENKLLNAGPSK